MGKPAALDERLRAALAEIAVPLLSDCLGRLNGIVGLRRFNRAAKLIGTAFTVKTRPGDNLYVYRALQEIAPGDVLVVDAGGGLDNAIVGDLLQFYARSRGCAGFVVDGAIRDVAAFEADDFPCFAQGISHRGPFKSGPGHLGVPVSIGGQVVSPGDVVVGDEDGVVSFALADAERLVQAAQARKRDEEAIRAEIGSGVREQSWVAAFLEPKQPRSSA